MRIRIRADGFRIFLLLPVSLIGVVIRLLPGRLFMKMQTRVPAPYNCLLTKESIRVLAGEIPAVCRECKGLEVIRVQAQDGTLVSIRM